MDYFNFVRQWLPPPIRRWGNSVMGRSLTYIGPLSSWQDAVACSTGYQDSIIIDRIRTATLAVLDDSTMYEQDGIILTGNTNIGMALPALQLAAILDKRLSVLDFGGALGTHFLRWKPYLQHIPSVLWQVVEQPHFCESGRALYANRGLPILFHDSIDDVSDINAVLASSVLQFLPDPMATLAKLAAISPRIIVIDRTPFSRTASEQIFIQRVPKNIYPATYPMRALSRPLVDQLLSSRYQLIADCKTQDGSITAGSGADYMAMAWLRTD